MLNCISLRFYFFLFLDLFFFLFSTGTLGTGLVPKYPAVSCCKATVYRPAPLFVFPLFAFLSLRNNGGKYLLILGHVKWWAILETVKTLTGTQMCHEKLKEGNYLELESFHFSLCFPKPYCYVILRYIVITTGFWFTLSPYFIGKVFYAGELRYDEYK